MKTKGLDPNFRSAPSSAWRAVFLRSVRHLSQAALRALFEPWFFRGSQLADRRRGPFGFVPRRRRMRWR
jgi:hypothetical protein